MPHLLQICQVSGMERSTSSEARLATLRITLSSRPILIVAVDILSHILGNREGRLHRLNIISAVPGFGVGDPCIKWLHVGA